VLQFQHRIALQQAIREKWFKIRKAPIPVKHGAVMQLINSWLAANPNIMLTVKQ